MKYYTNINNIFFLLAFSFIRLLVLFLVFLHSMRLSVLNIYSKEEEYSLLSLCAVSYTRNDFVHVCETIERSRCSPFLSAILCTILLLGKSTLVQARVLTYHMCMLQAWFSFSVFSFSFLSSPLKRIEVNRRNLKSMQATFFLLFE